MIKGLEALCYLDDIANGRKMNLDPHKLKLIVEKELKAFEIIKKKNVNVLMVKEAENYDKYLSAPAPLNVVDCYGVYHKDQVLTKEEFDFIREELK